MLATSQSNCAFLDVRALEGQRGERVLFKGLVLQLQPGEVVWLRGRNGRGKTTLLRILAGLTTPADGEILLQGQPLKGSLWRSQLTYVAHANALKDDLSATEALAFLVALGGQRAEPAALKAALGRLGVADRARAPVRTLSQGQRRRVALARLALVTTPQLWLLDEPFDALDDIGIGTLNALLAEHSARGGAVLLTSHQALSLREPAPREFSLDPFAVGR
ncbi:MAG: cytochrome c biogenesis heme-transporting ATPase CcmA [Rubrivivax sp.]|jgi:heme exporter protein A|nr:cytochrome c biogenesis heme-transporting ATPase CcmA [Rubrivivax sp.]